MYTNMKNKLIKRNKKDINQTVAEITKEIKSPLRKDTIDFSKVVSTGSLLLDLAISGKRIKGGGIPGGIIVEIFGPSSCGKTAILAELAASIQSKGGEVKFLDPEARLDQEYCKIYGVELAKENYKRPDTVNEMFSEIWEWEPKQEKQINIVAADSLAALSTEMEMEDRDKMGMKRAKDFSEGLRKTCRRIAKNKWLIACTNQEREGQTGVVTPGGKGISYYSSLRIRVLPGFPKSKIKKQRKIKSGKMVEKIIGIQSVCEIKKSSIDEPFRKASMSIIFGYGIDDVRDQLQYFKEITGEKKYNCFDEEVLSIEKAIKYIEENNYIGKLKERTINLWQEVENSFEQDRKVKLR